MLLRVARIGRAKPKIIIMPSLCLTAVPHYKPQWFCALTLCLVLATISACAQVSKQSYFPITAGATWTYTGYFSSASDKPVAVRGMAHIEGQTLIHSKEYAKYVISAEFANLPGAPKLREDVRYYRIGQDGIYFLSGRDTDGVERLELPLPIPFGVKWLNGTVEAWAERAGTIKVGTHEYTDCLKVTYKAAGGAQSAAYYLAPGVGMIRAIYTDTTAPKSVMELTLEAYQP
jgi:hypothetical protein